MKRKISDAISDLPDDVRGCVRAFLSVHGASVTQLSEALEKLSISRKKGTCCIACRGQDGDQGYVVTNRGGFYECCVQCKRSLKYVLGSDNIFRRQLNDSSTDFNGGKNVFVNLPSIGFCRIRYLMEVTWASYLRDS